MNRMHVAVCTPCYDGKLHKEFAVSLLKLVEHLRMSGVDVTIHLGSGDALITRNRQNLLADAMLDLKVTHIFFVDSDIEFDPGQVDKLISANKPICCGVYPTKKIDWLKVQQEVAEGKKFPETALSYVVDYAEGNVEMIDGFTRVKWAGTGFMMIKRHVIEDMLKAYPELHYDNEHSANDRHRNSPYRAALFNCMISDGVYLSEDFSFCKRWTDLGGEIFVDMYSKLNHIGQMNFAGDYSTQWRPK